MKQIAKEKKLKTHLNTLTKEQIIELYLQKYFDTDVEKVDLEVKLELYKQSNIVLNDQLDKATEHLNDLEDKLVEIVIIELVNVLNKAEEIFDKAIKNSSLSESYYDELLDYIDQKINKLKEKNDNTCIS